MRYGLILVLSFLLTAVGSALLGSRRQGGSRKDRPTG